jgi:hypothetical protein
MAAVPVGAEGDLAIRRPGVIRSDAEQADHVAQFEWTLVGQRYPPRRHRDDRARHRARRAVDRRASLRAGVRRANDLARQRRVRGTPSAFGFGGSTNAAAFA